MPSCINVIHDIVLTFKSNPLNRQSFKDFHPFLTLFLGNLCRARCCCKHLLSKHGDHFMLEILASVFSFFFQYQAGIGIGYIFWKFQTNLVLRLGGRLISVGRRQIYTVYQCSLVITFSHYWLGKLFLKYIFLDHKDINIFFLKTCRLSISLSKITHGYQFTWLFLSDNCLVMHKCQFSNTHIENWKWSCLGRVIYLIYLN